MHPPMLAQPLQQALKAVKSYQEAEQGVRLDDEGVEAPRRAALRGELQAAPSNRNGGWVAHDCNEQHVAHERVRVPARR